MEKEKEKIGILKKLKAKIKPLPKHQRNVELLRRMQLHQKEKIPKIAMELAKKVRHGNYEIEEVEPLAVRIALFQELRKEKGGIELIEQLKEEIKDYYKETGKIK